MLRYSNVSKFYTSSTRCEKIADASMYFVCMLFVCSSIFWTVEKWHLKRNDLKNLDKTQVWKQCCWDIVITLLILIFQIIREFDRVNEAPVSETIQETWQPLVSIIIDLAKNETSAVIMTMIDGADTFSQGMFASFIKILLYRSWKDHLSLYGT